MKRKLIYLNIAFFALTYFLLISCSSTKSIKIAFSKSAGSASYEAYADWVKSYDIDIECVNMDEKSYDEALSELETCSGLILTGGPDVHPDRYGKIEDTARCEIDYKRDTLEFALIKKALEMQLPILAICRGEQILNVALGGSLIVDIPSDYDTTVKHQCEDASNCFHKVDIVPGTLLYRLSGVTSENVNSNHHQAVDKLADGFVVSARSSDGLIEAYELKNPSLKIGQGNVPWIDYPFMLAVQWHPERLPKEHPLSKPLLKGFIEEIKIWKKYVLK